VVRSEKLQKLPQGHASYWRMGGCKTLCCPAMPLFTQAPRLRNKQAGVYVSDVTRRGSEQWAKAPHPGAHRMSDGMEPIMPKS
jgi:hypothetical protein